MTEGNATSSGVALMAARCRGLASAPSGALRAVRSLRPRAGHPLHRGETGSVERRHRLREEMDGLRGEMNVLTAIMTRIDQWIGEQSPPPPAND